jgi:amidohydrolase
MRATDRTAPLIRSVDRALLGAVRRLREEFHRQPELAFGERRTAARVARELRRAGLERVRCGLAGTGVVGVLQGGRPGPTVALRADLDALPILEQTGLRFASRRPGIMHACGHDGHVAILLGAARLLAGLRARIPGRIKFIFQPAEEEDAGARRLVEAGVLRRPQVEAIFALHARPEIGAGRIELEEVPSAACDAFDVRVIGVGCHGAYPHRGVDPIVIGAQILTALQQVVGRQVAPAQEAVVTVGSFSAGSRRNIIPDEALLLGTIRTRAPAVRRRVMASVRRIAEGTAAALGGRAVLSFGENTPRVHNDPELLALVDRVGVGLLGKGAVRWPAEHSMGGEDFSYYQTEQGGVPGCLFHLGVECDAPLHSPQFDFGSAALAPGILLMANLALQYLEGAAD